MDVERHAYIHRGRESERERAEYGRWATDAGPVCFGVREVRRSVFLFFFLHMKEFLHLYISYH